MQINRTNYENLFLLYIDGELSVSEMQAVERFAIENSDLAAELDVLLETKLSSDFDTVFLDKEILFRTASNTINAINHEEQFLLFIDHELTKKEGEQTLAFLAANPELQPAFALLEQTKLPLETISFGDKSILYRKEQRKPVSLTWWRMGVAAAMIGLAVMVWNLIPTDKQSIPLVKTGRLVPGNNPNNGLKINTSESKANETIDLIPSAKNQASIIAKDYSPVSNLDNTATNSTEPSSNNPVIASIEPAIITGVEPTHTTIESNGNEHQSSLNNLLTNTELGQPAATPDGSSEPAIMHQTVYKELDTDDESKSLYLGNLELNRDKLRGFFRKASNLFKSKIKSEDDRNENANPRTLK